jgi:1-acyl-sn-glycerol-3-phosphate acyltransferase/nucleoside-diphosphate-sugar epimerase
VRHFVLLAAKNNSLLHELLEEFRQLEPESHCRVLDDSDAYGIGTAGSAPTSCVCLPSLTAREGMQPDLSEAKHLLERAAAQRYCHIILLSSALVYGTGSARQALACEDYSPPRNSTSSFSAEWRSLETLARESIVPPAKLTILRPAIVLTRTNSFGRQFSRRFILSLPGHDPVLQFLSVSDLAGAIVCAVTANKSGIFNVAPDGVVPLHQAIRLNGSLRLPIPGTLRRIARTSEALDLVRYSWTISKTKIEHELGFTPRKSSVAALREFRDRKADPGGPEAHFDEFGMDKSYIQFYNASLFKFLSQYYWRVEPQGLEHIPLQGRAVLVGMHRGFMPFDGVMALHTIVTRVGRYPRFLTHPGLLKFPFLANFMTKLGGVVACQESAERVLESGELVGIFPEGIQGAFTQYRQAYKLQPSWRNAFVRQAIRHRAPIIPFVTVGSAEIFPIFGKIKSRWWTRYTGWPCFPITPTFPILPVPLPSKWRTQFLKPIPVDQYPPEAAEDHAVVKAVSREVRWQMQRAVDEMVSRRRSIFFGSTGERRTDDDQGKSVPA